jgi:hypothetical protein
MQTTNSPKPYGWAEAVEAAKTLKWDKYIMPAGVAVPIAKHGTEAAAIGGVRSLWIDVTPALAAFWMRNNFVNRPMKEDVVRAYARDMLTGKWRRTHQGLAFNDKDHLIDGQHRLAAIVMAGVTVRFMVTFGLPSKEEGCELTTMDCVDRGATRSVADQLKIQHGFDNGGVIAAMCASLGSMCMGEKTRRLSVGQTLEVYRAFEHPITYVIEHRSKHHGLRQIGFLSGFAFALATETGYWEAPTLMSGWFAAFTTGENLEGKSPIALLRDFAMSDEAKLFARSMNRGLAELALQAIYLQKAGARIAKLELKPDGADHFRKLQAERVKKIAGVFQLPGTPESDLKITGANGKSMVVKNAVLAPAKSVVVAAPGKSAEVPAAATATPSRPSLEKVIKMAERHFGIDRRILLNRRATEDTIVSSRNCVLRCMEELGHGKADIAAATGFDINVLTGILSTFARELKVNQRFSRKYAAFRGKF